MCQARTRASSWPEAALGSRRDRRVQVPLPGRRRQRLSVTLPPTTSTQAGPFQTRCWRLPVRVGFLPGEGRAGWCRGLLGLQDTGGGGAGLKFWMTQWSCPAV